MDGTTQHEAMLALLPFGAIAERALIKNKINTLKTIHGRLFSKSTIHQQRRT